MALTAIDVDAASLVPARLAGNTASGDSPDALVVSGTLAGDLTLPMPGMPVVVAPGTTGPYFAAGYQNLVVPPGRTATLNAGAVLKFSGADLDVQGTLAANGSQDQPVVLTSLRDNSVGDDLDGDRNGDGPLPGDWAGVVADPVPDQPVPAIDLTNTTITYARAALTVPSGNATITGVIDDDSFGVQGPPASADASCPDGTVTAAHVDWGTPTGPFPYGTGPSVNGCVDVQPWVGEP
jgi:hypothetical protein